MDCGVPPVSQGVQIDPAKSNMTQTYESRKFYVCKSGFHIIEGSDNIICQANGTWSAPPICNGKIFENVPRYTYRLGIKSIWMSC